MVRTIGAFSYHVASAQGPYYRSPIVMHRERSDRTEPGRLTAALNEYASLSGWLSLVGAWPGRVLETGAHVDSLAAVADGAADIAAIDAVTHALLMRDRPQLFSDLVAVGEGPPIPCVPLIIAGSATDSDVIAFRAALRAAVAGLTSAQRAATLISGFHDLDERDYEHVAGLAVRR